MDEDYIKEGSIWVTSQGYFALVEFEIKPQDNVFDWGEDDEGEDDGARPMISEGVTTLVYFLDYKDYLAGVTKNQYQPADCMDKEKFIEHFRPATKPEIIKYNLRYSK